MKETSVLIIGLLFSSLCWAQDRPAFFPEDVESNTLQLKCLCKPGVINKSKSRGLEISFLHNMSTELNGEDGFPLTGEPSELTLQNLIFKLRFPVINKDGLKLIAGITYRPEHYDFQSIGVDYKSVFQHMDGKNLKSAGFEGLLIKSWNSKYYTSFRFRTLFNGDYSGLIDFNNRFAIYNVSGLFGIKKQEDMEWGIGLNFSQSFRSTLVLPFVMFNKTFNEKWGIEMVLPALVTGRYNISEKSILLFGMRYSSRSYSIDVGDSSTLIYNLNHSEVRGTLTLEQQLHPWLWIDFSTGLQYNFSTDFDAENNMGTSFQVEPGSTPFFKIGVFISPPGI